MGRVADIGNATAQKMWNTRVELGISQRIII